MNHESTHPVWITPLDAHGDPIGDTEYAQAHITTYAEGEVHQRLSVAPLQIRIAGASVVHALRLHHPDLPIDHRAPMGEPIRFYAGGGLFTATNLDFLALREAPHTTEGPRS